LLDCLLDHLLDRLAWLDWLDWLDFWLDWILLCGAFAV
jgi:hypothetical protein